MNSVHEDGTVNYNEYCGLECFEPWYYSCEELPSFCPCAPDSSCTDCLSNECGYWADDEPKYFMTGRCHHFCRDEEYEWSQSDDKCFEFDGSIGLTPSELCVDHDACESHSSCKDCVSQKLPSSDAASDESCIWLRDSFCAPRCDTRYGCDPEEDAFPQSCHCSSDTPCKKCLGDGCGWDGERCHLDCSFSQESCLTMDDFPNSDAGAFCSEYPCDPNPCQNGGSCIRTGVDDFECACLPDYRGETCNLYLEGFEVPFTVSAIDFHEYRESDGGLNGNCEIDTRVDAKKSSDSRCLSQIWNKNCFVGWTQRGDWLRYKFHNALGNAPVNIIVTIASARNDKRIRVSLEPGSARRVFDAPGEGWNAFEERVLETYLPDEGDYEVEIFFNDGGVNLCSVAVERRQSQLQGLVVPFTTGAIDYSGADLEPNRDAEGGDCDAGVVSAATFDDSRCLSNEGTERSCFLGWLQAGDAFQYAFRAEEAGTFYVKVILASSSSDKRVRMQVLDHGELIGESVEVNAPGLGWRTFREYYLPVYLTSGEFEVDLSLLDGKVNLCAVGVVLEAPIR
jgi:hypothetical protein